MEPNDVGKRQRILYIKNVSVLLLTRTQHNLTNGIKGVAQHRQKKAKKKLQARIEAITARSQFTNAQL